MEENKALAGILRRKRHTVPLGLRYWAFFKRSILEDDDVRRVFAHDADLDLDAFKEALERSDVMRNAPSRGRKRASASTARISRDMVHVLFQYYKAIFGNNVPWTVRRVRGKALGLFAKRNFDWGPEHSRSLFGIVCSLAQHEFDELCEKKYPSLFNSRATGDGVLFGPACLLNHSCDAGLSWSSPTTRGVPELFEGFHALRVKKRRKVVSFEAGDEICVCYGMRRKNFVCSCKSCAD